MNEIIICEGKTDSILISYFLIQSFGFSYNKKKFIKIPIDKPSQALEWYSDKSGIKPDVAIWYVGGFNRVGPAIKEIVSRNKLEPNEEYRFRKILVMVDMDEENTQSRIAVYRTWLDNAGLSTAKGKIPEAHKWHSCQYNIGRGHSTIGQIDSVLYVIPEDSPGALETYLLNALADEGGENKEVVNHSRKYIAGINHISFIKPRRFKDKACLGATLSVLFPDWVFTRLDEKLQSVDWSKKDTTNNLRNILEYLTLP